MFLYEGNEFIGFLLKADAIVFIIRWPVIRETESKFSYPWGCRYAAPDSRMRYTGKSFSNLDLFEHGVINPPIITRFINAFQFGQNGKIQAYVIYGIVFIMAIFIGTVLNFCFD